MSSTSLKTLLEDFVEEYLGNLGAQLGVTTAAGTTTSLVDLTRFGGPKSAAEWARGSPVRITGPLARAGQNTFSTTYTPATGTLALDPAITQPVVGDTFIIVQKSIADHIDRLVEALNRGLRRWCDRTLRTPLTEVVGGDLLGTAAYWTAANDGGGLVGTVSYVDEAAPEAMYSRAVQVAGGFAAPPNLYPVAKMAVKPGDVVDFCTWAKWTNTAPGGGGTATGYTVTPWDETNGAAISGAAFVQGAAAITQQSQQEILGFFTVPANCYAVRLRVRFTLAAGVADVLTLGPLVMATRGKRQFATQATMDVIPKAVGNFYTRDTQTHPAKTAYREVSLACDVENLGWGLSLRFKNDPPFPLYFDQFIGFGGALSADADTTTCPEDLALAAMAYEFFSWAANTNRQTSIVRGRAFNTSPFDGQRDDAERMLRSRQRSHGRVKGLTIRSEYDGRVSA